MNLQEAGSTLDKELRNKYNNIQAIGIAERQWHVDRVVQGQD